VTASANYVSNRSYYRATALSRAVTAPLAGDVSADVCVIGGGFTGVSVALELRRRNYDVVLLEAGELGAGASGLNGGQLGGGQRRDVDYLEARFGGNMAKVLWQLGNDARDLVKRRVEELAIPCDLAPGVAYAVHRKRDIPAVHALGEKLRREYGATGLDNLDARGIAELLGTDVYYGGWLDRDSAHLHPLNLLLGEAKAAEAAGVRMFENTRALFYDERATIRVRTPQGSVNARYLVLAMNGYLGNFEPRIAGKIMPVNNYIVATAPLDEAERARVLPTGIAAADSRFVINYFRRSADGRLLFGGGESYTNRFPRDIAAFVRPHLARVYPALAGKAIEYAWGGRLAITMNRMPHFGRLSPHVYFAHGYSGHGVGMAHMAGLVIAEAIAGIAERFDVFAHLPIRTFPGGRWLRWPGLVLGMTYYALRDRF
jgi:gamma-glutamylputrescine oxidase